MADFPDHFHIVRGVHDAHPHLLQRNDEATIKEFYWRAAWALHQADARWGMLTKSAGEAGHDIPGVGRVAHDAVCYVDRVPIVDIIAGAMNPGHPAAPAWGIAQERRESNKWVAPVRYPEKPVDPPDDDLAAAIRTLQADLQATRARLSELEARPVFTGDEAQELLRDLLANHLDIAVDVEAAGPTVKVLGRSFNLSHDHGVAVVLKLFGKDVRRTGQAARARAWIEDDLAVGGRDTT